MNEVICHGIPDGRELCEGDICNGELWQPCQWHPTRHLCCVLPSVVDITVYYDGFHGDLNETMFVGNVDEGSRLLVRTAYECMMKGIGIGTWGSGSGR